MLIGVIADDFTGASDIANTLAKGLAPEGGLRTAQFSGVPSGSAPAEIEAGVISFKSRTAPIHEAVEDSLAALEWLRAQGCSQIVFKYCSTFDSTEEGNIGPVADALADALGADPVVFCPAFPTTGRTVYQGHLFVADRLLSASGMERHPLTPMTDADLRRWLSHQTRSLVGHIPYSVVLRGRKAVQAALRTADTRFVIADAIADQDLLTLGQALSDAPLITGGSGIALGLPGNFIRAGIADGHVPTPVCVSGPEAILAGSCSGATRTQIDMHAANHPVFAIDVPGVMNGAVVADMLVAFCKENMGCAPLVYSSATPEEVAALQRQFGREAVAEKLDALFAETATRLVAHGYRRIVVAGGETSGAVAQALSRALSEPAMTIGPEIDPGVPVLTLGEEDRIALALKSGNFGAPDFFSKALKTMEQGA
ncbi:four-carbon acid sugar kinase family protein [Tateyamaria omphalii]|uniref:3-oxo-tetronate kinase n=1 Tax=Tateyamaria omphalii TaxID=299262 RepID=UPI001C997B91|nr:3-oxo-tetronate kinase [Tateyamaria omphalii]MBY5933909.1 four-carbon acid sugar kinase family protein [Tateyamaria omphalii]